MKLLTLNFLTCAIKSCKPLPAAFPLHIRDAELEQTELDFNPLFLRNIMPRLEWAALASVCQEVGLEAPRDPTAATTHAEGEGMDVEREGEGGMEDKGQAEGQGEGEVQEEDLKKLHTLLLETQIVSGKLVCGNCGHEYAVREGIANFLLPAHLV